MDIVKQDPGFEGDETNQYPEAVDGDIYLNPFFGDLWIVEKDKFIKINDGFSMNINDPEGFIKVGHID